MYPNKLRLKNFYLYKFSKFKQHLMENKLRDDF